MMIIVYDSLTGLGEKFAQSLGYQSQPVTKHLSEECILVTRNVGSGKIPRTTKKFIKKYRELIAGFVNNGDREKHGKSFCGSSEKIVREYGLKLIKNIEGSGTVDDIRDVQLFITSIEK
ncbi:class Ib ribonucleoside-diphosphate reductase assembly flavoprotein NrdI [Granulicatella seriolae]|uniref:Class Ib ribonucleoside-diphosphate reductase assembly flavoprotein NrdI n=1 Tax=Granulicatella seriolae TaxID=2967226 RepID=A0ABT1WP79_9LACT|nr:class Ib ribonucleoside-diphosphate reductase assembly flavoprotein NrdI [Granulicatella seriolae]